MRRWYDDHSSSAVIYLYNGLLQAEEVDMSERVVYEETNKEKTTMLYTTEYLQGPATRVSDSASTRSYEIDVGSITVGWRT